MQLGKISLHTSKTIQRVCELKNKNENKLATNPFGVSFKGNVIQADVFESSKKNAEKTDIIQRGKIFTSAVVSGINSFNDAFKSRMNAIVSFGKRTATNVFDTIERIGNTEISFDMSGIMDRMFPDRQYSVKNLSCKSVSELKSMWQDLEQIV